MEAASPRASQLWVTTTGARHSPPVPELALTGDDDPAVHGDQKDRRQHDGQQQPKVHDAPLENCFEVSAHRQIDWRHSKVLEGDARR